MRRDGGSYRGGVRYIVACGIGALVLGLTAGPALALGPPDPPPQPSVTAGNAQITVAFSPPANNGGSPILTYTATCTSSNGGASGSLVGVASPITVLLLTNGKTYTCRVTATSLLGTSSPSPASVAVVPGAVPAAPTVTSATGGNASISVAFTAGADNGFTITSFTASCASLDGGAPGSNSGAGSPITVSGLTNGKTYTCTVTATNAIGTSGSSLPSLPTIPSAPPGAPSITSVTREDAAISVAFTAPASDGGFPILTYTASCTSSNGGASGGNTGLTSPITVGSLTNGKTYTCTVSATNVIGTGPASAPSAPVVPAAVPDAPAQPGVARGNTLIVVSFTPPADNGSTITSYAVSCTSSNGGASGSNTGSASPITVSSLTNGKTYTCTVTATNGVGAGAPSPASPTAVPAAVPDSPSIDSVTRGNMQIDVAFTPGADNGSTITSYAASCTSSNGGVSGSNTGSGSPITVSGLTNGKTYTCTVTATNAVGASPSSAASNTVVPATLPATPAAPTAARGDHVVVVSFSPPADNGSAITSYAVSCTSGDGGVSGSNTGSGSPITVSSLTNGKTYTCTVTATNGVGSGGTSSASNAVVPAAVPDVPAAPTVTRANHVLVVTFSAPGDNGSTITSYTASCASGNGGVTRSQSGPGSPLTVTNVTVGKTYRCTVSATNTVGASPPSPVSAAIVAAAVPNAPAIGAVTSGNGMLTVGFAPQAANGSAITSFTATCTSSNGGAPGVNTGPAAPITVTGLTNAKTYTCRVTATNAIGTSASSPASAAVVVGRPDTPVNVRAIPGPASSSTGSLKVLFARGPGNGSPTTSYRVKCTSLNGGVARTQTGPRSPITVTGLTTGKTYLCSVAARNGSSSSADSSPARATVGAPGLPIGVRALPLAHGIALPFSAPPTNGSAIKEYRSRCVTGDSAVRVSPPQHTSPLIATNLVDGQSYICALTARNGRGVGAEALVGPVVAGRPHVSALAVCSGNSGSLSAAPGLRPSPAKPQTYGLSTTLGSCSGPYVRAARLSISFRSAQPVTCRGAINVNNSGSGTMRWTAPQGMGKSSVTLRLVFTSSSGHVTKAHVYGRVTSTVNVFTGSHVSGDLTLDRGLQQASDCSSGTPLTSFGVTAIKLRFS